MASLLSFAHRVQLGGKVVVKIFQEKLSSVMIESSSNILDLHNSQFVRNIMIAERGMLSTLLTSFPR